MTQAWREAISYDPAGEVSGVRALNGTIVTGDKVAVAAIWGSRPGLVTGKVTGFRKLKVNKREVVRVLVEVDQATAFWYVRQQQVGCEVHDRIVKLEG